MASRDYYSVLQVNPSASQEAIDASYARLSRLYDPQASKKRKAALRKQALEQAYEVLSDRQRRSEYDRLRSKGWLPGQPLPGASRASGFLDRYLSNPYIFAGAVAGGVVIVLVAIVLISLVGEGGTESAVTELPTVTPGQPTPTLPAQSPTTAPASPPEVAGEEVTLPSGLRYIEIQPGTAAMPSLGDTAVVNYTGWLQSDGTKFDSSLERPEPFSFTLGMGEVIQGWEEGVGA